MFRLVLTGSVILSTFLHQGCAGARSSSVESPVESPAESREEAPARELETTKPRVRLILWITVDQMRGDYLEKYGAHFAVGGFAWLKKHARLYSDAHYRHAITETAPGHATLFTGVAPSVHGIIGNSWLLPDGTEIASVTDDQVGLVGADVSGALGKSDEGRSPHQLLAPTLGDALIEQTEGLAHVVSVSVKDRGAILPGGARGLAFWLGDAGFVTSTYYLREIPSWLLEHQAAHPLDLYLRNGWPLSLSEADYQNAPAAPGYEPKQWSPGFPHFLNEGVDLGSALASSPFGDEAAIDLALATLDGEHLGEDDVPDLLAISLSSTDKIGHQYGPESRELEDQMVRLDVQLARLLKTVTQSFHSSEIIVALSADHGICESAEFLRESERNGRRLTESELERRASERLKREYRHARYLLGVASPYVYLNREEIERDNQSLDGVRQVVAAALGEMDGVYLAHISGTPVPEGPLGERILAARHPQRSGDIYIVPQRDTLFLQSESLRATHGSPWEYDTSVPLILAGPGVSPGVSRGNFDVRSLAPTVAKLIGIIPPPGANAPALPLGP